MDMGVIWGGSYTRMVKPIIGLQLENDISQKNSISMLNNRVWKEKKFIMTYSAIVLLS